MRAPSICCSVSRYTLYFYLTRGKYATLINARPEEIIFTSGATESDNIALFGVTEHYADKGNHIITCVTEHKTVLDCRQRLKQIDKRVTYLPVTNMDWAILTTYTRLLHFRPH